MLPEKAEILIIGAGILGFTLARELVTRHYDDIVIIEKEAKAGCHASGRNSGVLHAGVYYAPDSLKAKICLQGNRLMRRYCEENGLPVLGKGKVIVAQNEGELAVLQELYRRAAANGAKVDMVDERELEKIEPNARTAGKALFCHDTAQVDPEAVLKRMQKELTDSGKARLITGCRFLGIDGSKTARTTCGKIGFSRLVNAAGAHSDRLAHALGIGRQYRLIPFKGIYYELKESSPFTVNGNIYPVPDIRNPFLGVHFTRHVHGDVGIGPTAIPAFGRENYGLLEGIDAEGFPIAASNAVLFFSNAKFRSVALSEPRKYLFHFFFRDAKKLVKNLSPSDIEPSGKVGIRAQLVDWNTKELVMDFLVARDGETLHILNPVSPAFTCSLSLARQIVDSHF